jgi:hypothetical protein
MWCVAAPQHNSFRNPRIARPDWPVLDNEYLRGGTIQ